MMGAQGTNAVEGKVEVKVGGKGEGKGEGKLERGAVKEKRS